MLTLIGFPGVGATAGYVHGNSAGEPLSCKFSDISHHTRLGSDVLCLAIFQIGVAYAIGIVLALTVSAPPHVECVYL